MDPSGPHSHKDVTCTQSPIFGAFNHPQNPWCSLVPQTSPGSTFRFGMQQGDYGSVQLNPPCWWLTCLPWPGPSHQTASVATWEEKDGQTMLNPKKAGFLPKTGTRKWDLLVLPHLSICSGVWALWVSATSQLSPVIHRLMSSSQKAVGGRGGR